jgi:hypothetical protein
MSISISIYIYVSRERDGENGRGREREREKERERKRERERETGGDLGRHTLWWACSERLLKGGGEHPTHVFSSRSADTIT